MFNTRNQPFLFYVYIPEQYAEEVKRAMFSAGAGRYQHYDQCAWQTKGTGQFRPLHESNPTIGEKNKIEYVDEIKIECLCLEPYIDDIIKAMKAAHPYEEPAYGYFKIST